jgi:hypothetical protein
LRLAHLRPGYLYSLTLVEGIFSEVYLRLGF